MATLEQDILGSDFIVGDSVLVRCTVLSITPSTPAGYGGSGDSISLIVETPGNAGEKAGVTLTVSPVQCRFAGNKYGAQ